MRDTLCLRPCTSPQVHLVILSVPLFGFSRCVQTIEIKRNIDQTIIEETIQYRRYHVCLIRQDSEVVFSKSSPQFFLTSSWEEVLLAKITEDSCVSKSGVDRNCNTIISVNQFSNSCIMLTFCLFFIQLLVCSVCDWFYLVVQFWSSICLILSRIHYTFMFKDCKLLSVAFLVGQSRRD